MTNKHLSLFSPFMLTEKIKPCNRIVMAPMTTGQLILMEPSLSKNSNIINVAHKILV